MEEAMIAAGKYREIDHSNENWEIPWKKSYVYFIDKDKIFYYDIKLFRNKFKIIRIEYFWLDEVKMKYSYLNCTVPSLNCSRENFFETSCKWINDFDAKWKKRVNENNTGWRRINYDLQNRFSGVLFSKTDEPELIYSPFKKLSEKIASSSVDIDLSWELINSKRFAWSPKIEWKL